MFLKKISVSTVICRLTYVLCCISVLVWIGKHKKNYPCILTVKACDPIYQKHSMLTAYWDVQVCSLLVLKSCTVGRGWTYNFQMPCLFFLSICGSVLLALIISVHLTASCSSMKRSLYWFLSISTLAISTLVNLFLWAIGTSSSSSDLSFLAAFSASSLAVFSSSSSSCTRCCSLALTACSDLISSRRISCSLKGKGH